MLKKILLVVLAIVVVFLLVVAAQPSSYTVTRSATINAPPEQVFPLVNDFHEWDKWSPWAKLDPNMQTTYSGAGDGEGAVYSWTGNDDVGEGRMTILRSEPHQHVQIKLEFLKPFESQSITDFSFQSEGGGTAVNWTMSGENNFMAKAFMLFMGGMDKAVGPDFEKGLAQMKSVAEAARQ